MLCPNAGPIYLSATSRNPVDITGGHAHIVDYRGEIMSYSPSANNTLVCATIDIEALRQFRLMNLNSNWLKDLRTEVFRRMYEKPVHPKNLWLEQDPQRHAEVDEIYRNNIETLAIAARGPGRFMNTRAAGFSPRGRRTFLGRAERKCGRLE